MIVAEQKRLDEIKNSLGDAQRVLIVGCGTCVTVCFSGGAKEAAVLGSSLRMSTQIDGEGKDVSEATVQRQCEWEYLDTIRDRVEKADIVLSLGCGVRSAGVGRALSRCGRRSRTEHRIHRPSGRAWSMGRTLRGVRKLHAGLDRRHLSNGALLQATAQRSMRRLVAW